MELNFSELDTMNPYQSTNNNNESREIQYNYWEKAPIKEQQNKKKKVSFNDILSNMNLVVNKQGVLQFMLPASNEINEINETNNNNFNNKTIPQNNYTQQNSVPLDHSVKHSYIYNKYFKDYADPNIEKPVYRVPKTWEEYRQMLLDDRRKAIEHKKMIEQVKSKKMLFTTTPGMNINPRNIQPSKNNLRRMIFN